MAYVHEMPYGVDMVRHWANNIADSTEDGYEDAAFCIRQVETGEVYEEAIDFAPCRYTYEATDTPVESADATEQDFKDALERFGVKDEEE